MLPIVSTLLENDLGLLASAVLVKGKAVVADKTGVDLDTLPLPAKTLAALRRYQVEHKAELTRIKRQDDKLSAHADLADIDSARHRERSVASGEDTPLLNKVAGPVIAISTILLTFALFYMTLFNGFPANSAKKDVILYILGVLSAISTQIFSYYFGSSQGSADKSRTIDNLLEAQR